MNKAVLFIILDCIDYAKQVFEQIKMAHPNSLYTFSDVGRKYKSGERERIDNVRNFVIYNIDWECQVRTKFLEQNSGGAGIGVSSAVTWFFDDEPEGIIPEEDSVSYRFF